MTKSMKTLLAVFCILLFAFCISLTASAAEADVEYIMMENDQTLTIGPTGYVLGRGEEIAHTGAYVIFGNANTNISFIGNGKKQRSYDVTLHNLAAVSQTWHGSLGIDSGVTLNMKVIGVNKFISYNHPGIAKGSSYAGLDAIINLTVTENSSVEFNASYKKQTDCGMDDGITLNILMGECSVDMTAQNWYYNGFTVSNGTPTAHTEHTYEPTEDICKISCADCGMVLLDAPHQFDTDIQIDESTHADRCGICSLVANTEAHEFENIFLSEEYCVPKCTSCGYVNNNEKTEHSFVNGACEYCLTEQAFKVQNGDETVYFITWDTAARYINENGNCTLTLLCDAEMGQTVNIEQSLTVDLNGYTLSKCGITAYGDVLLTIIDSSEDKTGAAISSGYAFCAKNGGAVSLDGIRLNGNVYVYDGSIVISNVTGESSYNSLALEKGSITVNSGSFAELRAYYCYNYAEGSAISVKNITCSKYSITGYGTKRIYDTLADGYTLVYADESYVDVTLKSAEGEIKTVEHTHDYSAFGFDETSHWVACSMCCIVAPDSVTEAHTGDTPTCASGAICDVCKNEYSAPLGHTGGEATCISKAVCDECGQEYGETVSHSWGDEGVCTVCGATFPIELTANGVTKTYTSMNEALNFLYENEIENAQIKLLGNVVFDGTETVGIYLCNIAIDLNGYTLSGCDLEVYAANVTLSDTSEQGGGAITGELYLIGKSTFTVESGCLDGEVYLYPEESLPSIVIKGGSFTDNFGIISYGGSVTVVGGEFVCGVFGIADYSGMGTQLGIMGGKFTNGFNIMSESETILLSHILPDASCVKYLDADGNEISIDKGEKSYAGYVEIAHSGEFVEKTDLDGHWNECTDCGTVIDYGAHSGGEKSCAERAVCDTCKQEYGQLLPHSYEGTNACVSCNAPLPIKVMAEDEEFAFDDITKALEKAAEYASARIVLQAHLISLEEISTDVYGSIELDLAGFTVSNVLFNVYGSLTVDDTSKNGEGTVFADYGFKVYAGGSLTVNGGNIGASSHIEGNEDAEAVMTVNGGSFTGEYGVDVHPYGKLYINGGVFDCDKEEIYIDGIKATVIISGGEFPSGLEANGANISSVLTDLECIVCVDENGNTIAPDSLDTEYYREYMAVVHGKEYLNKHTNDEVHWYECKSCDYVSKAQEHTGGVATCIEKAECSVCGIEYGEPDSDNHAWNDGEITTHPTCTKEGIKIFTCTRDISHTRTEEVAIDENAHSFGEWTAKTEEGIKERSCTYCGHTETEEIPVDNPGTTDSSNTTDGSDTTDNSGATDNSNTSDITPEPPVDNEGISGGAIAGIVVGSVAVVGIGGFSLFWFVIKKKK